MTESRWPNEYDQILWTWLKNCKQQTLTLEHDQKILHWGTLMCEYDQNNDQICKNRLDITENESFKMTNLNVRIWPKIIK